MSYILQLALASLAVYIGILPISAYYFNIISPVTILANLLVVPLLGLTLSVGILFIVCGAISGFLAVPLSFFLHILFSFFIKVTAFLSHLPFAYFYIPDISLYGIALYYLFIILMIKRKVLNLGWGKIFIAALLVINIFIWKPSLTEKGELKIDFLDTKNAVCAFLEFPNGRTMLIDSERLKGPYYNQAESIIIPFIWSRQKASVDAVFLVGMDPRQAERELPALEKIRVGYLVNKDLDYKKRKVLKGFGDVEVSATSLSELKLVFKEISILFSSEGAYLYLRRRPEVAVSAQIEGLNRPEEFEVLSTKRSGALAIITDGLDYSIKDL
jgi:competence protein ComEC